ncbi:MAG: DoxX family protein [Ignavibacteria bacterium]
MILTFLDKYRDFGLLLMRLGLGISYSLIHGWGKISAGPELWGKLGNAMSNLGITFLPHFWGFMAAFSEFFGSILLVAGLFFRPAAFLMAFTMFVAMMSHLVRLDPWSRVFSPMVLMFIFAGLFFIGPGKYSLDELIRKRKKPSAHEN